MSPLEWFEDEAFWQTFYPYLFKKERFDTAPEQVESILALTGLKDGDVLDLCCGPGRHSTLLAGKGFKVTGVDRSAFLLDKARYRGEQDGVSVEWVQEDMRRFVRHESYDLALNLFTSFGYFDDPSEDLQVLANLCESLRPGGTLVMEMLGKEILARIFRPTVSEVSEDGSVVIQRHEIFDGWSRIRNEWILIEGDVARRFAFHHSVYSARELKDRLIQTGFGKVEVFGDLGGSPYDPEAQRLVAVARKPR